MKRPDPTPHHPLVFGLALMLCGSSAPADPPALVFSRAPLQPRPYVELPLGSIRPEGFLRDELERMAAGMTGHLDAWYPEVCGDRNAWLGGDGDTWERGPYWIDGLYPLAQLLEDEVLLAKARRWIDWTLEHQRGNGQIGPLDLKEEDRTRPPPRGAQVHKPDDWWPRMVMLKILQQHYQATGDLRVAEALHRYFRFQLETLPDIPLHDPANPRSGSWWAAQRGGDNLMVVLWFYRLTGESYLLELADILYQQTIPATAWFESGEVVSLQGDSARVWGTSPFHCVNLAQVMKTPLIRFQQDGDPRHLAATRRAFQDIQVYHGQPHGLYGGDETMHGRGPERGSELCSAVEMMFSLEKMVEITGKVEFADRLESIAYNMLPTQMTDDHFSRQYFQQVNQVQCTFGERDFFDDGGDRVVYGLLTGYPCCTCNLHQGWPKFVQHLWMAAADGGLAAWAYGPCRVTANVADGVSVTITEKTAYPFEETVRFEVEPTESVSFPLHLRIPGWCEGAGIDVNGEVVARPGAGSVAVVDRTWRSGDRVTLTLPMSLRSSTWDRRSVSIERGPLLYALRIEEDWTEVVHENPDGVPPDAMHRGYRECRPADPWNYALLEGAVRDLDAGFSVRRRGLPADGNPWNLEKAPIELQTVGVRLPGWTLYANSAGPIPLSPAAAPEGAKTEMIRLVPYGCTTLRIAAFPTVRGGLSLVRLEGRTASASHVFSGDSLGAIADGRTVGDSPARHTFWPRKGSAEWIQYEFDEPRRLSQATVFWFDDTGRGECRTPASWRLLVRIDGTWNPVDTDEPLGTRPGVGNVVRFSPVTAEAVRLDVRLRDGFSAGVVEWDVR